MVDTAEELDVAVRQQAHEIAGLVQPGCRLRAKRIRDELLCGELRPVQVARGELHTAHQQLPRHADGQRLQVLVHHVGLRVGKRTPYWGRGVRRALFHLGAGADDGILGGTIVVDQAEGQLLRGPLTEPVAAGEQDAQCRIPRPALSQRCFRERRGQKGQGYLLLG